MLLATFGSFSLLSVFVLAWLSFNFPADSAQKSRICRNILGNVQLLHLLYLLHLLQVLQVLQVLHLLHQLHVLLHLLHLTTGTTPTTCYYTYETTHYSRNHSFMKCPMLHGILHIYVPGHYTYAYMKYWPRKFKHGAEFLVTDVEGYKLAVSTPSRSLKRKFRQQLHSRKHFPYSAKFGYRTSHYFSWEWTKWRPGFSLTDVQGKLSATFILHVAVFPHSVFNEQRNRKANVNPKNINICCGKHQRCVVKL